MIQRLITEQNTDFQILIIKVTVVLILISSGYCDVPFDGQTTNRAAAAKKSTMTVNKSLQQIYAKANTLKILI